MELLDTLSGHAGEASVDTLAGESTRRSGRNSGAPDIVALLSQHTQG